MADNVPSPISSQAITSVTDPAQQRLVEVGVAGLKVASGYVYEEYLPQLRGLIGIRTFQEMSQNDATIGAILRCFTELIRSVDWNVTPAADNPKAVAEQEFVESLFDDMSHSWEDFIVEALSMLTFGWSMHEIVLKLRNGPDQLDASQRSRYTDGRIGLRKLAPRSQDSLLRWEIQPDGGIQGMHQLPPAGGAVVFLPIERCLLFRTTSRKNNPEGISILRTAYRSWHFLKYIEQYEAVGIERELCGLPVVRIPQDVLASTDPKNQAIVQQYIKIARDTKLNEQGGIVIPSDCFANPDGNLSNIPLVDVKLLSSSGTRSINTTQVISRHQNAIARSVLADFLMLGQSASGASGSARGSSGMHQNQSELFMKSLEAVLDNVAAPINRYLLPRLWQYNNLDPDLMPEITHGRVNPIDLTELGTYVTALAGAGMPLFPDDETENFFRDAGGIPAKAESNDIDPEAGD